MARPEQELADAFAREGIAYPAERMEEASLDYAALRAFMRLIGREMSGARDLRD